MDRIREEVVTCIVTWKPSGFKNKTYMESVTWLHTSLAELTALSKKNCPVDTGRLRSSITWEVDEFRLTGKYGSNVEYTKHVEEGTTKMTGSHFLERALQQLKPKLSGR